MFKFTKSSDNDLGKLAEPIQYKVLCDWLRNIHQQNIQLARKLTILNQRLDVLLEDEPRPDVADYDPSPDPEPVH